MTSKRTIAVFTVPNGTNILEVCRVDDATAFYLYGADVPIIIPDALDAAMRVSLSLAPAPSASVTVEASWIESSLS